MNETLASILTRRSVREFSPEKVSKEHLELLVEAALSAPSAHGRRSWHVAVIEDPALRAAVADRLTWFQSVRRAPVAILVLGDPDAGVEKEYWPQDCAALTENILIAARSLGLGTTWCGIYPLERNLEAIRSVLDIPSSLVPFCMIAVGHPFSDRVFRERNREGDDGRVSWYPPWGRSGRECL